MGRAQRSLVTVPGTEVRHLHSDIVNQDFEPCVKLPWRYDRNDATYPVLFSLDGNRSFPLHSTMSLILETPGTGAQEVVVVGIGYRVDNDRIRGLADWAVWRTRDLTPERNTEVEQHWIERLSSLLGVEDMAIQTGGASALLEFMRRELVPFVEANYGVSFTDRALAGFSYGGLFTLYGLLHAPETFTRYYAGSPSMWDQLSEYEEACAATHDDLEARVFITPGDLEFVESLERVQKMVDRLRSREYPGLQLDTCVFAGEEHSSGYAAGVSRALRVLYGEE